MDAIATRTISRPLTQIEVVNMAKTLTNSMSDRERIVLEKKSVMDDYKAKIEEKDETIHKLSHSINSGNIDEEVTCIVRKNYADRVKEFIHEGEIIAREPMSLDDVQMDIE
jgi:hypothetical protein